MIKFESITPNLMVTDVNATVDFYTQVLDFQAIMTVPETGKYDWAMVMRDGTSLMFQSVESLTKGVPSLANRTLGGSQTFYVKLESGLEALFAKISASSAQVHGPIIETFYGAREFLMTDMNGYVFSFAEDLVK
jgi:lactoylglutathione lyase